MSDEERRIREDCGRIAALESYYWAECENESIAQICIGRMGAAANICGAILLGTTAEEYEKQIAKRKSTCQTA